MNHYEYKETVVKNNPQYVDKLLLLSNKNRDGLHKTTDDEIVQLKIDSNGLLQCNFIKNGGVSSQNYSLRKIGIDFLGMNDPSVRSVLKYLIKPEMEIERIFNSIRFKYLQSILVSNIQNPSEKISADFNRAFQSFAGIQIYQGKAQNRVENDNYWIDAGFTQRAKNEILYDNDFRALDFIIKYLRQLEVENYNRIYVELIAIKPGFHEIYNHDNYFDSNESSRKEPADKDSYRDIVFKSLRGFGDIDEIHLDDLRPKEINRMKYFSYAPCNVTEGPFVFRKKIGVSYFDEIRKINGKKELNKLENNFHILDYYHNKPTTRSELKKTLKKAEQFKKYMNN